MAKDKLEDWAEVAADNLDMGGISLAENVMRPPAVNNEMREHMAQVAKWLGDETIVAAATTDIGTLPGRYISITGNTAITSFGTIKAGTIKYLKFTGTPTITYNAASLILPSLSSITAASGDTAVFVSEGSGNWRCVSYQRAAYMPSSDTWETVVPQTPFTGQPAINSPNLGAFRTVEIEFRCTPNTDAVSFGLITSANNGSSYATAAGDYYYTQVRTIMTTVSGNGDLSATEIALSASAVGNGPGEGCTFKLTLFDFNQAIHTLAQGICGGVNANGDVFAATIMGKRNAAQALNAFRVFVSSGTFSGYYTIRGIRG